MIQRILDWLWGRFYAEAKPEPRPHRPPTHWPAHFEGNSKPANIKTHEARKG